MLLRSLAQLHFRNLTTSSLRFHEGVTAVVGRNAAGKSNLLDAVYLGCTGDVPGGTIQETLRIGTDEGYVAVEVAHDEGTSKIEIGLAPGRKVVRLDGQHVRTLDISKVVTSVRITPEDADLIHGSPSGRRGYLDGLLGRLSPRYAMLLREYQRVVEQRNALLKNAWDGADAGLDVWSDRFVALGDEIDDLRLRAMQRVDALAAHTYAEIAGKAKRLEVRLDRSHAGAGLADALAATRSEERARGVTVVGPHRDDVAVELAGHSVQAYGSRGEARTAALALRVAEYRLLAEKHGEAPVLLLDDFTAELDASRREYLLALTASTPQALVSGTEPPPHADQTLHVEGGAVHAC